MINTSHFLYLSLLRIVAVSALLGLGNGCTELRRTTISLIDDKDAEAKTTSPAETLKPEYDGLDAKRERLAIRLAVVGKGLSQPTDIQPIPGRNDELLVLEKGGRAVVLNSKTGASTTLLQIAVLTASEQGLLGAAFSPKFTDDRTFYLNYIPNDKKGERTRIAQWQWPLNAVPKETKVILEVVQPYQNHNAGQLAFGPDGYLYVGLGDGGWADDPHDNGQNPKTLLGSMLRLDVSRADKGKAYSVPKDNPFVGDKRYLPETWAFGLRNPWRYFFDEQGRLIVADVGQNTFEEISIVERGGNYGWNGKEGFDCFKKGANCKKPAIPGLGGSGFKDPFLAYGRDDGGSITGGYVSLDEKTPKLKGKYVFGDYLSGRLWAVTLPSKVGESLKSGDMISLGRWPIGVTSFGRDQGGRLYVADFNSGTIYRIETP